MRNIKKVIAAILCMSIVLAVYVPFGSAEDITEETTAIQQLVQLDSEEQVADQTEKETEHNEENVEETTESEEESVEETTETEEETDDTEEESTESEEDEAPEEDVTEPEEELPQTEKTESYSERLAYCVEEGLYNMGVGVAIIGMFFTSPLFFVIPPIGVVAMIGGLPVGLASLFVGAGEVVASPVLALFIDTDTSLVFI